MVPIVQCIREFEFKSNVKFFAKTLYHASPKLRNNVVAKLAAWFCIFRAIIPGDRCERY